MRPLAQPDDALAADGPARTRAKPSMRSATACATGPSGASCPPRSARGRPHRRRTDRQSTNESASRRMTEEAGRARNRVQPGCTPAATPNADAQTRNRDRKQMSDGHVTRISPPTDLILFSQVSRCFWRFLYIESEFDRVPVRTAIWDAVASADDQSRRATHADGHRALPLGDLAQQIERRPV